MSKLALVTGITGQDGSYLSELLLDKNYTVYGIVRCNSSVFNYQRIDHIKSRLNLKYGDLTDGSSLVNFINEIILSNNDYEVFEIYNLGAQSHVQISFENPEYTSLVDGIGTLKLLEAIRSLSNTNQKKVRFYQASTSEMFGGVLETPQKETTPFNPQSPYACAKVYSHFLVKNYREGYNLFACSGILFNHESPRRGDNFVTKKIINFVKVIKELQTNNNYKNSMYQSHVLKLGNLNSKRDWGHAKDYVYGMWLMLQQDKPDDYILAMGQTYSVREFVEKSFEKIDITIKWIGENENEIGVDSVTNTVLISIDKKYFRPCEVELLLGDSRKARQILNWQPNYDNLDKLITSMLTE
jgi:GDPmannose 4,6-dehydratase